MGLMTRFSSLKEPKYGSLSSIYDRLFSFVIEAMSDFGHKIVQSLFLRRLEDFVLDLVYGT